VGIGILPRTFDIISITQQFILMANPLFFFNLFYFVVGREEDS